MNDVAINSEPLESPEARFDAVPQSIMEHTEFFSALSHELRTPLAAIKGFAQMLSVHWDSLPDERRRANVDNILRSTMRLERLVTDLSLSSRLVDGVSLESDTIDAGGVVEQAVLEAQAVYPNRHFTMAPPSGPTPLWADRERMLQVLLNLLDNAAKYSPAAEPIVVRWLPEGQTVRIEVRDAGTSLTAEEQSHLFVRYGRLHPTKAPESTRGGSGLGLYICKALVDAMHGAIGITTGADGRGNTFWLALPTRAR